jgi:hypothetical protein
MDGVCQGVAFHLFTGRHGGLNGAHQRFDVAGRGASRERRFHGTATLMAEDNYESGAEMLHRVLDAAQRIVIDQIAGDANDKQVSDALVEDDFGSGPRIRASYDDGERLLPLGGGGTARGNRLARAHLALREALIPGRQTAESLIGGD